MNSLIFHTKFPNLTYPIIIDDSETIHNTLDKLPYNNYIMIFDENTRLYTKNQLNSCKIKVPTGELAKSIKVAADIYNKLIVNNAMRRSTLLIGVGGGAICDLVGFVAMTYMRGISYALYPTTLVAMVDAAIGSKVGINGPNSTKNLIGGFYSPQFVKVDIKTLNTLPSREYKSAFAEIIKIACIANDDGNFFYFLEKKANELLAKSSHELLYVIEKAITKKIQYTEHDLTEKNLDRFLNLGHTFAHGIESAINYSMLHGECVAIGIAQACRLGLSLGLSSPEYIKRVLNLLQTFALPVHIPPRININALKSQMETIKNIRDGDLREVVPIAPGNSMIIKNLNIDKFLYQDKEELERLCL